MFDATVIVDVTESDAGYSIATDSWGFFLEKKWGVVPKVGQVVKTVVFGGSRIRGVYLDDQEVYNLTDEDLEREHQEFLAETRQKEEAELPAALAEFNALPEPWKSRVDTFRQRGGHEWDLRFLNYEVFCCKEATKIAEHCKDSDGVRAFHKLSWEEQIAQFPALSKDHSGNTFGAACQLAQIFLEDPRYLPFAHGALDALVGCGEYHCFASLPNEEKDRLLADAGITPRSSAD